MPLLELVKARRTEQRPGTASEPAEPRQSTPGEVAEPSQATLQAWNMIMFQAWNMFHPQSLDLPEGK